MNEFANFVDRRPASKATRSNLLDDDYRFHRSLVGGIATFYIAQQLTGRLDYAAIAAAAVSLYSYSSTLIDSATPKPVDRVHGRRDAEDRAAAFGVAARLGGAVRTGF